MVSPICNTEQRFRLSERPTVSATNYYKHYQQERTQLMIICGSKDI